MNRPSVTLPSPNPVSNTSYNEANQMLSFNDKNIIYDNNGNMTSVTNSCGTTNYTWDVRNRLAGINGFKPDCTSLTASFKYDALNRRIEKIINGTTTQYVYDGVDIIQEKQGGIVKANYIRGLNIDEPLARITQNAVRFYLTDALGSVIGLTDDTGVVKTTYSYDPFGNTTVSGESSNNPFQYTGRENDGTGLYYYRAKRKIGSSLYFYSFQSLHKFLSCTQCSGRGMDRIAKEVTPLGTIDYTYDNVGRRKTMQVAGQPVVNYDYYNNGWLENIRQIVNAVEQKFNFVHDNGGRRERLKYFNGASLVTQTVYGFDNASRLLTLDHLNPLNQILESLTYTYDPNGNRISMNRPTVTLPLPNQVTNTSYNSANQMLSFNDKNIIYDNNGNMMSVTNWLRNNKLHVGCS